MMDTPPAPNEGALMYLQKLARHILTCGDFELYFHDIRLNYATLLIILAITLNGVDKYCEQ